MTSRQTRVGLVGLAVLLLLGAGPAGSAEDKAKPAGQEVKFDTYGGYFVSNQFEPAAPASFVVIRDPKRFDEVFGVARVMGDKSHRLAPGAFDTQIVIAAVKRGKTFWDFKIQDVRVEGGVVTLRYTVAGRPQEGVEYACPLIVSIPKGEYAAVRFVENDKPVGKVDLAPAAKPAEKAAAMPQ
jgi:hypothetical protein